MNKILNWTFGSIFRTIGRIIAYILVGALAWFFISGLDLSDWRDKLIISPIQNWRWVSLPKVYAKSGRLFIDNVSVNGYSMQVPTTGWYYSSHEFTIPQNSWNNKFTITFNEKTFETNTDNFITGIYVHNVSDEGQTVQYAYYNGDYVALYKDLTIWSMSMYYDGPTGFNYCNPVNNNGEFFYFQCPVMTESVSQFVITLKMNRQYYDYDNKFTFGVRSAMTTDFDTNDINQLITEDKTNTQNIINSQNNTTNAINNQTQQQHTDSVNTQNAINNQTQQQHQDSQALNETITDDTPPDVSSALDNDTVAGWLPPGPIDSLVNLPLTLFNSLTNAMGGSCGALTVPLPFINKDVSIPCMSNVYGSMGFSSFFNWIGVIASAFILFSYLMKLYKWVDDTLTFRENNHLDNWGGV